MKKTIQTSFMAEQSIHLTASGQPVGYDPSQNYFVLNADSGDFILTIKFILPASAEFEGSKFVYGIYQSSDLQTFDLPLEPNLFGSEIEFTVSIKAPGPYKAFFRKLNKSVPKLTQDTVSSFPNTMNDGNKSSSKKSMNGFMSLSSEPARMKNSSPNKTVQIGTKKEKRRSFFGLWSRSSSPKAESLTTSKAVPITKLVEAKTVSNGISRTDKSESFLSTDPFYFVCEPFLDPQSIRCISLIPSCMGKISEWPKFFEYVLHQGFNWVHLLPIQSRGISRSPYSIKDQLQLDSDYFPPGTTPDDRVEILKKTLMPFQARGLNFLSDMVWNHTSNSSEWLDDMPDSAYHLGNSPWLAPALELDNLLFNFSCNAPKFGLPSPLKNETDVLKVIQAIQVHVLGDIKLWEYYIIDVEKAKKNFTEEWANYKGSDSSRFISTESLSQQALRFKELKGIDDSKILHYRFPLKVSTSLLCEYVAGVFDSSKSIDVVSLVSELLDELNLSYYIEYDHDKEIILEELYNSIKYTHFDPNGPRYPEISEKFPAVQRYFTRPPNSQIWFACNGWIWNHDPKIDFAGNKSRAYLQRRINVWNDCIKLRYYDEKLWDRMEQYTYSSSKIFQGIRIDNNHSTPLDVATRLTQKAREANPSVRIISELFTNSHVVDLEYITHMGISAIVREALQSWSPTELAYQVSKYSSNSPDLVLKKSIPMKAGPSPILFDMTHDNITPTELRTTEDSLPTTAIVSFVGCAIGTCFGYDFSYAHKIDILNDRQRYLLEKNWDLGMNVARRLLNSLHSQFVNGTWLTKFTQLNDDVILIQKFEKNSSRSINLIAYSKFERNKASIPVSFTLGPYKITKNLLNCKLQVNTNCESHESNEDDGYIRGLNSELIDISEPIWCSDENIYKFNETFVPGSISIFEAMFSNEASESIEALEELKKKILERLAQVDELEANIILYRCELEEKAEIGDQFGAYMIPNYGQLEYCGLSSFANVVRKMQQYIYSNSAFSSLKSRQYSLAQHLESGTWAMWYISNRLQAYSKKFPRLESLANLMLQFCEQFDKLPVQLRVFHFSAAILAFEEATRKTVIESFMPDWVRRGESFIQDLALTSIQLIGPCQDSQGSNTRYEGFMDISMAAGLPHFAHSWMRCWGRDIALSLGGLAISLDRRNFAEKQIMSLGALLFKGLIPNLIDGGVKPRYNSRDAVWFWLAALKLYVETYDDGILQKTIKKRFKNNQWCDINSDEAFTQECSIMLLVLEILTQHYHGITFREPFAGPEIDTNMRDLGFNINLQRDEDSGFILNLNQWNCSTWQDKMGSSEKSGNKGVPATPRDGCAIELAALQFEITNWILSDKIKGLWMELSLDKNLLSYNQLVQWKKQMENSFDDKFWNEKQEYYNDLYKSFSVQADTQFRSNFLIAAALAPSLFNSSESRLSKLKTSLKKAEEELLGPYGMKTLTPKDKKYRPFYDNSDDSSDYDIAQGFSYHNGPEWVFLKGMYLKCLWIYKLKTKPEIYELMLPWKEMISKSQWKGLQELTNANGEYCPFSSETQAWSSGLALEVIQLQSQ